MELKIAVLPGDGIGPEVINEAVKVLGSIAKKYNHKFKFEEALVGAEAIYKTKNPLPDETLELCKNSDAILFGAIGDPYFDNNPNEKVRPEQGLLKLRKECNLFLNIRPVKAYDFLIQHSPLKKEIIEGSDLTIFRELTGGLYFGEKKVDEQNTVASDLCTYHSFEIERVAHLAFKTAKNRRQKVTLVDKANVLETSRLWRKVVAKVAEEYKDITLEYLFVDNAAMQLVLNPKQFDVVLTENLFGDILSDQASAISGSIGLLPSASVGDKFAMFEPIHGSFPQAKGKGIANPCATILSAAMLLEHFNLHQEASDIYQSVEKSLEMNFCTSDINPDSKITTEMVGDFIKTTVESGVLV